MQCLKTTQAEKTRTNVFKKTVSALLCICLMLAFIPSAFAANQIDEVKIRLIVGDSSYEANAVHASYENNTYLSMRSLAEALKGTSKQFDFSYGNTKNDGAFFSINSGGEYIPSPAPSATPKNEEPVFLSLSRNRLFVDGAERRYYTYRYGSPEDIYMSLTDIQLLFDITVDYADADSLKIYPDRAFSVRLSKLQKEGYFDVIGSVLAGDSAKEKILFSVNADSRLPVASISKLMSYLIISEAVDSGKIAATDIVSIPAEAAKLSRSEDGIIKMNKGQKVPMSELITAMLVASSNEAALALAVHAAGSEEEFVRQMNSKAKELGMEETVFYNASGLPTVTMSSIPVKRQNSMSADDLFRLICCILKNYPQITDITSQQFSRMEALDYTTANSNPLVFNMENVTGLKTGNTIASGSCVAACDKNGKVVIVLGAEDAALRGRAAEILFRCS